MENLKRLIDGLHSYLQKEGYEFDKNIIPDMATIIVMLKVEIKPYIGNPQVLEEMYRHLLPDGISYTEKQKNHVAKYIQAMCELV